MRGARRRLLLVWLVFFSSPLLQRRWETRHIATTENTTHSRSSQTDSNKRLMGLPFSRRSPAPAPSLRPPSVTSLTQGLWERQRVVNHQFSYRCQRVTG